ncbi:MAG: glycerol-3-phosphate 1-O-acyltransferase [Actinobacteria bacterium]|nr:glycerol-3-phosphate 1-O-acyltransferase [Actinomycetota bacterium]
MALEIVPDPIEPGWPDAGARPVTFLVDVSSNLERRLLLDWISRERPPGSGYRLVDLPPSRRHRLRRKGVSPELQIALEEDGDALLAPLRVAWLAPEKDGRRAAGLLDLLLHGDPRDPSWLRQQWIVRRHPDRVTVIAGEPAPVAEVRARWIAARTRSADDPSGFAEFVAFQGSLALERSERRIRGNRYKVPRFVAEDLLSRTSFRLGLLRLAERSGQSPEEAVRLAARYLKEIAATHSTFVIDLTAALIRVLYTQGYAARIHYDRAELRRLAELGQHHSLVFLPSHKSNLDHLVLMYVLYDNGLPPNHTAGGDNMNFFPAGPLLRRAGVFFIRRTFKDNEPYKFVLKRYVDYLLAKRFSLEWFMEGGRSRSGKLRAPKFGMLAYVADSVRRGSAEDAILIPVSIAYDQVLDIGSYTAEAKGGAKERESFSWMVRTIRTLRRRYGGIHLRFGDTLSLAEEMKALPPASGGMPEEGLAIQKLAFEVALRINRATPITPISLVTLALLGARDRALTVEETMGALQHFLDYVADRNLPVSQRLSLDTPETVEGALEALRENGVVSRFSAGPETVYSIEPEQHLAAAFYRNTIIHFFINGAIAELALLAAAGADGDREAAFWDEVMELRDLLKFEFFFPEKDEFRTEIEGEILYHRDDWRLVMGRGRDDVLDLVRAFDPYRAHWVLRPFLEAYRVVADALESLDYRLDVDEKTFLAGCMGLGKQYRLQHRIQSDESVSTILFGTALRLAGNRGLLMGGGLERLEERRRFAAEIRRVIRHIDGIEALAAARRAGLEA